MFKLAAEPTFTHTVKIRVPVDGGFKDETFKATFRVVPLDAMGDTSTLSGQLDLLCRAIVSLGEIVDDEGQELPYSDELRDRLIQVPYVRVGLHDTYLTGVLKARSGN